MQSTCAHFEVQECSASHHLFENSFVCISLELQVFSRGPGYLHMHSFLPSLDLYHLYHARMRPKTCAQVLYGSSCCLKPGVSLILTACSHQQRSYNCHQNCGENTAGLIGSQFQCTPNAGYPQSTNPFL